MSGRTLRLILDSRVEQRVSIIRMAEHFLLINHIGIPPVENGAFRGFCHIGNKFSTPVAVGKTGNLFIQLLKAVGIVSPGEDGSIESCQEGKSPAD
mgnify:CR=1 FL=1